jgi:hypothetical protein
MQLVVARLAVDRICAFAADKIVVAIASEDFIISAFREDDIPSSSGI